MIFNVLAVGDVVGEQGLEFLLDHLRPLQRLHEIHFTVVNGENASGLGILGIKKIKTLNLLPALLIPPVAVTILSHFGI